MAGGSSKKSPKRKSYVAPHPKGSKSPSSSSRNVNEDMSTGVVDRASPKDEHHIESCSDNDNSSSASPKHTTLFSMQQRLDSLEKHRVLETCNLTEAHRRELGKLNEAHTIETADLIAQLKRAQEELAAMTNGTTANTLEPNTNAHQSTPLLDNNSADNSSGSQGELQKHHEELKAQLESEAEASRLLRVERDDLLKALDAARQENSGLKEQLSENEGKRELEQMLISARSEKAEVITELDSFKRAFECPDYHVKTLFESVPKADISGKLKLLLSQFGESRQKNLEMVDGLEKLGIEKSAVLREKNELQSLVDNLRAQLDRNAEERSALVENANENTAKYEGEKRRLMADLQKLKDEAEKNLAAVTTQLQCGAERLREIELKLTSLKEHARTKELAVEEQLRMRDEELLSLRTIEKTSDEKLRALIGELEVERNEKVDLKGQLENIEQQFSSECKNREMLEAKLVLLNEELASERKLNQELNDKIELVSQEAENARKSVEELASEQMRRKELEDKLESIRQELVCEQTTKEDLKLRLTETQTKNDELSKRLEVERQELEEKLKMAETKQKCCEDTLTDEIEKARALMGRLQQEEQSHEQTRMNFAKTERELSAARDEAVDSLKAANERHKTLSDRWAAREATIEVMQETKLSLESELGKVKKLAEKFHHPSSTADGLTNCSDIVEEAMGAMETKIGTLEKMLRALEEEKSNADISRHEHQKEIKRLRSELDVISSEHERLRSGARSLAGLIEDNKDAKNLSLWDIEDILDQFELLKDELETSREKFDERAASYQQKIQSLEEEKSKARIELEAARRRVLELESAEKHRQDQESKEVKEVRERFEKAQINLRKLNEELENNRETCKVLKAAVSEWQTKKQDADLAQKSTQMALVRQEEELEQVKRSYNAKSEEIKALQSELEEYRTQLEERKTRGLLRRLWNAE